MNEYDAGRDGGLLKVIPERIKEAREARGLTGESFADLLGITRQAVAQYETGQNGPSAQVLSKIIAITQQPTAFFISPRRRKVGNLSNAFWRSLKRMEQSERIRILRRIEWAADIVDYLQGFIDLPEVNLPDFEWDYIHGSDDDIEELAMRVRQDWGLGYGPVEDMAALLEYHGVILVRDVVSGDDMDAVSVWQAGRPYVLYSRNVSSQARVNFNLAHELAHLILHGGAEINSDHLPKLERQANRFAGAFLLPRISFSKEVISTSISYFETLKSRWRVAIAAMIYRCKDLEILNESQVKYLWRQMNVSGIRKKEPLDDRFPVADPSVLRTSLEMLVLNGVQSKIQIEEAINLNPDDIEALGGTKRGWMTMDKIIAFNPRPRAAI